MPKAHIQLHRFALAVIPLLLASSAATIHAQGIPTPSPDAKACAYLPVAELEAHFGSKAQNVRGIDQTTRNTCSANFPNPLRAAVVESHPPTAADQAMTAAQRIDFVKGALKSAETKDFGSVGCIRSIVDMGEPVHTTMCFLAKSQYLALSVHSVDPAQVSFEAVKILLEKAAVRRR
jgi:hypothetical protein